MQFKIEQLALCPRDPVAAKELLTAMGAGEWAEDHVMATGHVFGDRSDNEANLSFSYQMLGAGKELEVLEYTSGNNWMEERPRRVSHIGMHCSAEELGDWRRFFTDRGIEVAQEVKTTSHTNPHIAGKRWYHYVIFDTFDMLSTDIKLIVRRDSADL